MPILISYLKIAEIAINSPVSKATCGFKMGCFSQGIKGVLQTDMQNATGMKKMVQQLWIHCKNVKGTCFTRKIGNCKGMHLWRSV